MSQALWSFAGAFLGGFTAGLGMEAVRNLSARRRNRRAEAGLRAQFAKLATDPDHWKTTILGAHVETGRSSAVLHDGTTVETVTWTE